MMANKNDKLKKAALELYYAGYWSCDRKCNEALLWENLREALGLPSGTSPKPLEFRGNGNEG